jgi:pimeloyl-ACP methyl ester carboxylesterase
VALATTGLLAGGVASVSGAQAAPNQATSQVAQASTVTAATDAAADAALTTAAAAYTPPAIKWTKCGIDVLDSRNAQCGYLVVPLDYKKPKGTKIKLAVSRVKHTVKASKYQGIMLVNPGGPGGSGLTLSVLGEFVPKKAGANFDWIGFDPRGVGSSVPSLSCDGGYFLHDRPDYRTTTAAKEKVWLARSKAYAAKCKKSAGSKLLAHAKTTDTVADMDSLRKALGRKQLSLYGFSYGTYLGQVYATLHPKQVHKMVLDGDVDPRKIWYSANLGQNVAFEKSIKVFFGWVAKYDSVYHLGTTEAAVEAQYYTQLDKLDAKASDGVGSDELNDVFVQAGYYVYGWTDVASAFAGLVNDGSAAAVRALYDDANPSGKGTDNGFAMYLATQCTEGTWPAQWSTWTKDNAASYAKAPFLTYNNEWFNAPCHYWGAKSSTPVKVNGSKAPAILLINETLDGATPYSGAIELRKRFPKARLIEGVGGTTHAGSLSGVDCTDLAIAAYLNTGKLPKRVAGNTSDKQCSPVPQPDPTSLSAATVAPDFRSQILAQARTGGLNR